MIKTVTLCLTLLTCAFCFSQEICDNSVDDDGDGLVDLNDSLECSCQYDDPYLANPSFENKSCCDTPGRADITCLDNWEEILPTFDYYNCNCPHHCVKNNPPFPIPEGTGFVGFVANILNSDFLNVKTSFEYISTCLKQPIKSGEKYSFEFDIAEGSYYDEDSASRAKMRFEFSIFGAPDCNQTMTQPEIFSLIPTYPNSDCPADDPNNNWIELGSQEFTLSKGVWNRGKIEFTAPSDIHSIAIGPSCLSAKEIPSGTISRYFFLDQLVIKESVIVSKSVDNCNSQVSLSVNSNGKSSNWQWYRNGVALLGENDSTMIVDHVYGNGIYTAMFEAKGYCDTISFSVQDLDSVDSSINIGNDTILCKGQNLILDAATAGASYIWSDGSTNATLNVNQPGQYWVNADVNGCSLSDTINVSINTPAIDLGQDTILCNDQNITLDGTTIGATYSWSDGSTNATLNVNQPGKYWVEINVNGCTASDSVNIDMIDDFSFNIAQDILICQGENYLADATTPDAFYTWSDGSTNPTLGITVHGKYWVDVTVNGCKSADTLFVSQVPASNVDLGKDTTICKGSSIFLKTGTAHLNYRWNDGSSGAVLEVSKPGEYWIEVGTGACKERDSILVFENDLNIDFSFSDTCINSLINFTGTSDDNNIKNWSWEMGDGNVLNESPVTHSYSATGTYPVKLVAENNLGCSDLIIKKINIHPAPAASFSFNPQPANLENPEITFTNTSTGGLNQEWFFGDGNTSKQENPNHLYTEKAPDTYNVKLIETNIHGCIDSAIARIVVDEALLVFVPNAFTPNNIGPNDVFTPVIKAANIENYSFQIFNRWGEIIFQTNQINKGWDGTFNDGSKYAKSDLYVWKVKLWDQQKMPHEYNGYVTLLR